MIIDTSLINVNDIPHAIQLALGPVFLLTGIAGILNVMTGRLARIIDRARFLSERDTLPPSLSADTVINELQSLENRRYLASSAIAACTFAALAVCMVVATLFLEVVFKAALHWLTGGLFIAAALGLVIGLSYFLREVNLATKTVRFRAPKIGHTPSRTTGKRTPQ